MNINATLFAQFIVFFTLVWVVMRFIWPPLIKALDERRNKIAEGLAAAEQSVAAKAAVNAEVQVLLQKARLEANELVNKAQHNVDDMIEKSREDARVVGEREIEAAHSRINIELSQAKEELRKDVVALSIQGASKIIGKEVNKETHAKLLKELADQL